jgi:hypothetical protein
MNGGEIAISSLLVRVLGVLGEKNKGRPANRTAINTDSMKLVFKPGWLLHRIMANIQNITPKAF